MENLTFKGIKGEWKILNKNNLSSYVIGTDNYTICFTSMIAGASSEEKDKALSNAKLITQAPLLLLTLIESTKDLEKLVENNLATESELTDIQVDLIELLKVQIKVNKIAIEKALK
jgi:hypothetical protein